MSKTVKYFFIAATCIVISLYSGNIAAKSLTTTLPTKANTLSTHYFHQGKFSLSEGEFKMSENTPNNESFWEKTKEVSAKAWDATIEGATKAWDKTKEVSSDMWEATKETAAKAGDTISEKSEDALDKTKETSKDVWEDTKKEADKACEATKEAAENAKDKVEGDNYDNPMYNPENKTSDTFQQKHTSNN